MLLTRLYLRNFRVFEDELDLALPPGLVGVYGPNGAGKSTLLEAILFTMWGRSRTSKDEIRSAGVGGDCVTEVEFEHEGHLYLVRRRLTGINSTPRADASCDGLQMSEGVRDTGRYLHSVLGMDDAAFRASVFAEQKQLAAFSGQTPAERRHLVLQLLGVTPLEGARDAARRDARVTRERHAHLRGVLPDLDALRTDAGDADAAAAAAEVVASELAGAAEVAARQSSAAAEVLRHLDELRQRYDQLVVVGKAAKARLDTATASAVARRRELDDLDGAAGSLAAAEAAAAGLDHDEALLQPLRELAGAVDAATAAVPGEAPPAPDPTARTAAAAAAEEARSTLARVEGEHRALAAELDRARAAAGRSGELSPGADCPLCGQALGAAWEQVQAHRSAEVDDAAARLGAVASDLERARRLAQVALDALRRTGDELGAAEGRWAAWDGLRSRHDEAVAALRRAAAAVAALSPGLVPDLAAPGATPVVAGAPVEPSVAAITAARSDVERRVAAGRAAAATAERLRGRLDARPGVEAALAAATTEAEAAGAEVESLRTELRTVGHDPAALDLARRDADTALAAAAAAERSAQTGRVAAATARAAAGAAATRLADAEAQHATLEELATDSVHLGRLADLLSDFRNAVVASVGPRLAVQAAELFSELTDHEYDELQVDPETYGLQISDAGRVYGLERFSGSEVDLANLALRVAISEQIRFQSGGSVGLLVLDEVFGPLDEQRKERMLAALERLRGRFRQVLVVTHDGTIKEQLPNAVEVVKRPGRRATARLLAG